LLFLDTGNMEMTNYLIIQLNYLRPSKKPKA
jgi:hypothetical protein